MDKARFIELAPLYYAVAIVYYFRRNSTIAYAGQIENYFKYEDAPGNFLEKEYLLQKATKWLIEHRLITELQDEFGPPVLRASGVNGDEYNALVNDASTPFHKFFLIGEDSSWLYSALRNVNDAYDEMGIAEADFENPDLEWEPLPLDRDDDPALKKAIDAVDETIAQVRGDNGYSATRPEEKEYILSSLEAFSNHLKYAASVSLPYVQRFALEPLGILLRRFRGAVVGIAAQGARDAILEFIKEHGKVILDTFLK